MTCDLLCFVFGFFFYQTKIARSFFLVISALVFIVYCWPSSSIITRLCKRPTFLCHLFFRQMNGHKVKKSSITRHFSFIQTECDSNKFIRRTQKYIHIFMNYLPTYVAHGKYIWMNF